MFLLRAFIRVLQSRRQTDLLKATPMAANAQLEQQLTGVHLLQEAGHKKQQHMNKNIMF